MTLQAQYTPPVRAVPLSATPTVRGDTQSYLPTLRGLVHLVQDASGHWTTARCGRAVRDHHGISEDATEMAGYAWCKKCRALAEADVQ